MTQSSEWKLDPADPRAPPTDVWARMTTEERARLVASLPSEWEAVPPPEGDPHYRPKVAARQTLERFFSRIGRKVYIGSELPTYYPNERVFAPDVFAVLDVEPGERERWVVDVEGKGLDWALEIFLAGDRRKDHERNVERYARLGIAEYFLFDRRRLRLQGWKLPQSGARVYQPLVPQGGRFASATLGLEIGLSEGRLRFFVGDAELPESEELIARLERAVTGLEARLEEEARRAEEEARRAEEEARGRAEAEARLRDALDEVERLRKKL